MTNKGEIGACKRKLVHVCFNYPLYNSSIVNLIPSRKLKRTLMYWLSKRLECAISPSPFQGLCRYNKSNGPSKNEKIICY